MNIEWLQQYCSKLPAVTEDIKWDNDLCFSVGGRMFCVASLEPPFKVSFKVPDDQFDEISQSEGFIPAPYMARAKWVSVIKPAVMDKKSWEHHIMQSYELIKKKLTAKLRRELGIDK